MSNNQTGSPLPSRGPVPTPKIRFYSIERRYASEIEKTLDPYNCLNLTSKRIPKDMLPNCFMTLTALHPDAIKAEQSFPGVVFVMYDCGLNTEGGRTAAIFIRMDPSKIDCIVKEWRDKLWVRESVPPTMLFTDEDRALQKLEQHATEYIRGWYASLDKGYHFTEPIREMRGPAREALRSLILYWLPNFQY